MGRSRVPRSIVIEDLSGRTRRSKRLVSSIAENSEFAAAGQGTNEGERALFHCNYCNKDVTGKIRIKCAVCPDFDLCLECFSVGAEITPHKSNHPYRVMDKLSFPLICPDWNADEEMLLVEGLEMYGFGNWEEVAEHAGTKSRDQCLDHYNSAYMNSPCFPLPDMSYTAGKNRDELLAVAKEQEDANKASTGVPSVTVAELSLQEQPTFSPALKTVEAEAVADVGSGIKGSNSLAVTDGTTKTASNIGRVKDIAPDANTGKVDRSVGVKKPKALSNKGPFLPEVSGYNPKRREFDPAYDNEAEKSIADLEFKDTDTADEREIKLRMLHIYNQRIAERKRRMDFILERGLLYPDPLVKDLDPEERELYEKYKVFMRFHSKEEHDELIEVVIAEHRARKRIQELEEARAAGCRTSAQADKYHAIKKKLIAEEKARMNQEGSRQVAGVSGKVLFKAGVPGHATMEPDNINSPQGVGGGPVGSASFEAGGSSGDPNHHPSTIVSGSASSSSSSTSSINRWDITGLPGAELLSGPEKRLCMEIKLIPNHYLKMLEAMSIQIYRGGITKKSDAYRFFNMDPNKVDKIYDMLVRKGIASHSSN
ncbi:transcriptional adapter ADA2-like [Papaver somniferum]|uniref:transcriptional adapter ADA2-like n=1 Tax=Papaver somniferum TaxID=3469 RepID=UPI000E6F94B8|nr:transcriptional adapter ADA2-like [Papaver somniferum]